MIKLRVASAILATFLILAVGCVSPRPGPDLSVTPVITEPPSQMTPASGDEDPEVIDDFGFSSGEIPQELFESVLTDLLSRIGEGRSSVTLVSAQAITWNDGSLGCPQPGAMYTQALVNGFQVIFDVAGETYDYRLSDGGYFTLCSNPLPNSPVERSR